MAVQLTDAFIYQFSDADGLLVGGKVYFYEAGSTSTTQPIYLDAGETTEAANPQILGDLGDLQQVLYLNGDYNIVITDADDVQKFQRDNFDVTASSGAVLDWMQDAQSAKAVIGRWTTVITAGITIAAGDVIIGDSAGAGFYELRTGGNPANDPESDTYDSSTGVGTDWISLAIANAPVVVPDITNLQNQIDALEDQVLNDGYINGLGISNNSTDSEHDVDFATGAAQDSTGEYRMIAGSAFTKAIDADWAVGSAQGGFPDNLTLTGDTWYRVFIIGKQSDSSDVDYGFDTSATAANLLNGTNAGAEGFDIYRQIGWVRTTSASNIYNWVKRDSTYYWVVPSIDYDQQLGATTAQLVDVRVYPGGEGIFNIGVKDDATTVGATSYVLATGVEMTDSTPSDVLNTVKYIKDSPDFVSTESNQITLPVDSNSQIRVRGDLSGINVQVWTQGYYFTP